MHEREARSPLRPESWKLSRGFDAAALSCYLSFISKHSDTKWDTKKKT